MGEMIGADVSALDDLARRFAKHAKDVEQATRSVDSIVAKMRWHGPAADEFRNRWQGSTCRQLQDTTARFQRLSRTLHDEADQQRKASSPGAAGGGNGLTRWLSNRAHDVTDTARAAERELERELDGLDRVFHEVGDTTGRELDRAAERVKDTAVRHGLDTVLPILLPQLMGTYVVVRGAALVADVVEETTGVDLRAPGRWVAREALGHGEVTDRPRFEDAQPGDYPDGYSGAEALQSLDSQAPNTVKILQTGDPDHPRYVVMLRGMDPHDWDPHSVNTPPQATLQELLHGGAYEEAVQEAMRRAEIPPGSEVMLIGHSQGGITAMDLAADPGFNARYKVTHVLTAGSPAQDMFDDVRRVNPGVQMLALDNRGDPVPGLDTGIERGVDGASHVAFSRDHDAVLPHGTGDAGIPSEGGYSWMMDRIEQGSAQVGTDTGAFASSMDSMYFQGPPTRTATAHLGVDGGLLSAVISR